MLVTPPPGSQHQEVRQTCSATGPLCLLCPWRWLLLDVCMLLGQGHQGRHPAPSSCSQSLCLAPSPLMVLRP